MVTAIVLVRTERERVQEAAQAMLAIDGVTEAYSVTGPYDLVVMVRIPDFESLAEVVPERIAQVPGVARTETMVAFRATPTTILTGPGALVSRSRYRATGLQMPGT